ncbi:GNAT family N-acetyltransferase [Micromonospora avicenniae]|uniref:GNAT family N-acetyltransferase n=1 Tax=Micromonospora avicenniae TaxID=1198245 RepID=UPI00333392B3
MVRLRRRTPGRFPLGQSHPRTAFVYNVAVEPDVRRQGYGRAIMLAAERWCRDNALTRIGLRVFAHNTGARALYEQLGFTETARNMAKDLRP